MGCGCILRCWGENLRKRKMSGVIRVLKHAFLWVTDFRLLEKYVCRLKWMSTLCLSLQLPCYSFFIACLGFPLFMRVLNPQAHIFPDWLAYMKWKIYRYRNVLGNANTFWAEMGWRPFLQWALIKIKLDHKWICHSFCLVTCRHFTEFFFSPSLLLLYI